jgi:hypothetical protein
VLPFSFLGGLSKVGDLDVRAARAGREHRGGGEDD